jgi:hypothetical protein
MIKIGSSELAEEDVDNKMPEMPAGHRIEISIRHLNYHFINFCYDLLIEGLSAIFYMVSLLEPFPRPWGTLTDNFSPGHSIPDRPHHRRAKRRHRSPRSDSRKGFHSGEKKMENYNFESQIEETSKLMREWYESLIPETLRKLDRQLNAKPRGTIDLIFFKSGNIKGCLTTTKYDKTITDRIKNIHYFKKENPEWNSEKKRWEAAIAILPDFIFAFPDFELSPLLLERFPSVKELQEDGARAIAYISQRIDEYAREHKGGDYFGATLQILGEAPAYRNIEPKAKELAWRMGFTYSNWKEN